MGCVGEGIGEGGCGGKRGWCYRAEMVYCWERGGLKEPLFGDAISLLFLFSFGD